MIVLWRLLPHASCRQRRCIVPSKGKMVSDGVPRSSFLCMLCSCQLPPDFYWGVVTVGARTSTLAFPYLFHSQNALHHISDTGNRRSPRRYNTLRVQAQAARWTGGYEVRAGPRLELVVTRTRGDFSSSSDSSYITVQYSIGFQSRSQ